MHYIRIHGQTLTEFNIRRFGTPAGLSAKSMKDVYVHLLEATIKVYAKKHCCDLKDCARLKFRNAARFIDVNLPELNEMIVLRIK